MFMSTVGFIHVIWETNEARIKSDPPFRCIPGNVNTGDPDLDQIQVEGEDRQARRYDYYRDIKAISLLARTTPEDRTTRAVHFTTIPTTVPLPYNDECAMLSAFWNHVHTHYITLLGGWNLSHCSFPLIVGKALQHGIPVPSAFMPNPFKKFQDPAICELSTLYTQSSFQKARPLPDLNDIGSWWGLPTDNALPPVSAVKLASLTPEEMDTYGFAVVERSLNMMADMLLTYSRLQL